MSSICALSQNGLLQAYALLTILSFWSFSGHAQDIPENEVIISKFSDYSKTPREIAYAHLNKTVYIKGETVAFKVYIFDKYDKGLSKLTKNLYWNISDSNGKIVKKEMILVENGVAQGNFFTDSLFTSGNYTFKAYTNWMRNFKEQNHYVQNIKIIDPNTESKISSKTVSSKLDAQFLPEGGHLVADTENTMGVIIKDSLGIGVPFVAYSLRNEKDEILNSYKTNAYGISKFDFTPNGSENYHVTVDFQGDYQNFTIKKAEVQGVTMSLKDINNKVAIRFGTNNQTLEHIKNKSFTMTIHNGKTITATKISFGTVPEVIAIVKYDLLSPGINIFTLFDENKKPLLERLFFNYEGIEAIDSGTLSHHKEGDSLRISVSIKNLNQNSTNSFSVSILPEASKSYNPNHNIFSSVYLQPFIQGQIEDAGFYFTNIDRKKKFELDNLLLTQGWSSYDWNTIFNSPQELHYDFESGIRFTTNVNKTESGRFLMYPLAYNYAETFEITAPNKSYEIFGIFPLTNEKVRIGEIDKNQNVSKATVYLQFSPSKIPDIRSQENILPLKEKVFYSSNASYPIIETSWSDIEQLDEVVLKINKTEVRTERLKARSFENVDVFNDLKRFAYVDLAAYLRTKGFRVSQYRGNISINSPWAKSGSSVMKVAQVEGEDAIIVDDSYTSFLNQGNPLVYVDDVLILDYSELISFDMSHVDYVSINKLGFGEGLRGSSGVIKIYTDPNLSHRSNSKTPPPYQEIDIPLTFSTPKKFYAPKYQSYSNQFYKDFGVVDWVPNLKIDDNGNINFKISDNQQTDISFYIEGTDDNGRFLSEVKTLEL